MRRIVLLRCLAAVFILLVACNRDDTVPGLTPTVSPTVTIPTPAPAAACPPEGNPSSLPAAVPNFADLDAIVLAFLSAGGDPGTLRTALEDWGVISANGGMLQDTADLTGDGFPEVVLVALDVERATVMGAPGTVFVFTCRGGAYSMLHRSDEPASDLAAMPEVVALSDLQGDGRDNLAYTLSVCGAHTCEVTVRVLGHDVEAASLRTLLSDPIEHVPFGEIQLIDEEGDGMAELVVHVGTIGSAGAGPQREFRDVYSWDGVAYVHGDRIVTTPREEWSAIHLIQDADRSMRDGRVSDALALYEEVLVAPPSENFDSAEQLAALHLFARFRMMVIHAVTDRLDDAAAAATIFAEHDAGGAPGFLDIGRAFWFEYEATDDAAAACAAASKYAEAHPESFEILNTFGYANPAYEAHQICGAPFS